MIKFIQTIRLLITLHFDELENSRNKRNDLLKERIDIYKGKIAGRLLAPKYWEPAVSHPEIKMILEMCLPPFGVELVELFREKLESFAKRIFF